MTPKRSDKCECKILDTIYPEVHQSLNYIDYCPLHALAPEMAEILQSVGLFLAGSESHIANAYSEDIKKLLGRIKGDE